MDVVGLTARVAEVDATASSPAELVAVLADVARLQSWLTAVELSVLHRLRHADTADATGDPVHVFANATRCGARAAARAVDHADTLALVPGMARALRDGDTTPAHLHTLTTVLKRVPKEERHLLASAAEHLVHAACTTSPERFTRTARAVVSEFRRETRAARIRGQRAAAFVRTWTDPASGMTVIHGELDPVTGFRVAAALACTIEDRYRDRVRDELLDDDTSRDHLRAHALAALVLTGRRHLRTRARYGGATPPPGTPSPDAPRPPMPSPEAPHQPTPANLAPPRSPSPTPPPQCGGASGIALTPDLTGIAAAVSCARGPATERSVRGHRQRAP